MESKIANWFRTLDQLFKLEPSHFLASSLVVSSPISARAISISDVLSLKDHQITKTTPIVANDIYVDNIKLVGHWRYNTDGIDMTNTSNVTIKIIVVKALSSGGKLPFLAVAP